MLDRVTDRRKMREELVQIIRMLMHMPPPVAGDLPAPGPADTTPIQPAPADQTS
jgi:acetyl-CoA carboxylase carboxyl transferase subunit beta